MNIDKSSWNKVKLADIAIEYSKRINDPSKSEFERFVGSNNIKQWDYSVNSWESTSSVTSAMKLFEPNDYLLVRRSLYASDFRERAPRATFSGVCSGDILTIKENSDSVEKGYLIAVLNNPDIWKFIVANASGSITRRIKWKDLSNYQFMLPPKQFQRDISKLLWSIEELLAQDKITLGKLEQLRYTLHKKHFSNYGKSHKRIGAATTKVGSGVTPKGGSAVYKTEGVRFIRSQNVLFGSFSFSDVAFITDEVDEKMSSSRVYYGDLLLNITGASIGRTAVYRESESSNVNQHVCIIRVKEDELNPDFLSEFINSAYGQKQIQSFQAGGNREGLNFENIKLMRFPNYDIKNQNELVNKYKYIIDSINKIKERVNKTKQLKLSIINKVF